MQWNDQEFATLLAKQEVSGWNKILKIKPIKRTKQLFLEGTQKTSNQEK